MTLKINSYLYYLIYNMATFVKKVSNIKYYEIDGIRAAGIVPYFISGKKVFILVNKEFRDKKIVYNSIGGKVDSFDNCILDTAIREFNEETGYIASDLLREEISKNIKIHLKKPKYISYLIDVKNSINWKLLPYNYKNIFENIEVFNDRDSLELKWVSLFDFNYKNCSYLLNQIIYNIKNIKKFKNYDQDKEPLFLIDD